MLRAASPPKRLFSRGKTMKRRKPFSILKWLVFPSLTLALAIIVAWFNVTTFGWQDGARYLLIVAAITGFSIAINKYVKLLDDDDPTNDWLATTAFVFEIVLTAALIVNAAYSLSVQRSMSVGRQAEKAQTENLDSVSKLKSKAAQREAARMLSRQADSAKTSQSIFAENERALFWIMVGELIAYAVAAFTLYAVSSLVGRTGRTASQAIGPRQESPRGARQSDFPEELDMDYSPPQKSASMRPERPNKAPFAPVATVSRLPLSQRQDVPKKATSVATEPRRDALNALRTHLRVIAEGLPKRWFKADLIEGGVAIRLCERQQGREVTINQTNQSDKLLLAVDRPDFRERL